MQYRRYFNGAQPVRRQVSGRLRYGAMVAVLLRRYAHADFPKAAD